MSEVIQRIKERAKSDPKRIVFPESDDDRIIEAVQRIKNEGIAKPFLLTHDNLDPEIQEDFAEKFFERKQMKGMTLEEARESMEDPLYFGAMMVRYGRADGFVAGAKFTTSAVIKAAINCLSIDRRDGIVSSCFIMDVPNCDFGANGTLVYADCGVIPYPTSEQLAKIAISSARFAQDVLKITPRVAMLSFSTKGSAQGRWVDKMKEAVEIARSKKSGFAIDGELQADAALVAHVAQRKLGESDVAGEANVLIFPNLDAGNICYKLTQRLAKARAIGPITIGTVQPCSDLSRGCSVEDIIDCTAVTVVRAQAREARKIEANGGLSE
ncbi:MAG: phosphate acetyltransferase [Candidatus Omnitrophica bacterium]|nr:phosphate acetyltransferase [Candidatus Omnitrophota bacterium]